MVWCVQCGVVCAMCGVVCAMCGVVCAMCGVVCAMCGVVCAMCGVVCAMCGVCNVWCGVVCAMCGVVCAMCGVVWLSRFCVDGDPAAVCGHQSSASGVHLFESSAISLQLWIRLHPQLGSRRDKVHQYVCEVCQRQR